MPQEPNRTNPTASTSNTSTTKSPTDDVSKAKAALATSASHLKDDVKTAASDAASTAKKAAESKLDAGRDFAAEHLGSVAEALRKTGDELKANDSALTDYVAKAATSVDQVSHYLQTRTLSQLMGDMEGFARREPAMFLGGAFVAGIFGGRFLKAATPAMPARGMSASGGQTTARMPALPAYGGGQSYNSGPSYGAGQSYGSGPSYGSGQSQGGGQSYASGGATRDASWKQEMPSSATTLPYGSDKGNRTQNASASSTSGSSKGATYAAGSDTGGKSTGETSASRVGPATGPDSRGATGSTQSRDAQSSTGRTSNLPETKNGHNGSGAGVR